MSWKKRIVRVMRAGLIFVAGGCVINIGVAWTVSVASDIQVCTSGKNFSGYGGGTLPPTHYWIYVINQQSGAMLIASYVESAKDPFYFEEVQIRLEMGDPEVALPAWANSRIPEYELIDARQTQLILAVGWPWKSMYVSFRDAVPSGLSSSILPFRIQGRSGILVGSSNSEVDPPPAIPLSPLWLGFVGNSALWTSLLVVLVLAPRHLRRRIRSRRGRCARCGYDLRGNLDAGCPECGWNRPENEGQESSA